MMTITVLGLKSYLEILLLQRVNDSVIQQGADRCHVNVQFRMLHQLRTSICVHNPRQHGHVLISFQTTVYHFL